MTDGGLRSPHLEMRKCPCNTPEAQAQLNCPGIDRNADDWVVVLVSVLYGATSVHNSAYIGMTRLNM